MLECVKERGGVEEGRRGKGIVWRGTMMFEDSELREEMSIPLF